MPSVTICTFLTLTNSFKLFDQNLSLTAGEPAKQSMMLAYNIYDTFYARSGPQWKGIGQAKASFSSCLWSLFRCSSCILPALRRCRHNGCY